jgi:hypothetical protein
MTQEPVVGIAAIRTWFKDGRVVTQTLCNSWIDTTSPQQGKEPVAWGNFKEDGTLVGLSQHPEDQANWTNRKPLYTTPPQQEPEPQPASEEDMTVYRAIAANYYKDLATPPQRTWVGLSDEEYIHITDSVYHQGHGLVAYYIAIEAKLKQKNGYAEEKN